MRGGRSSGTGGGGDNVGGGTEEKNDGIPPAQEVCDSDHLSLCTTKELCEGANLYWYDNTCHLETKPEGAN